MRRWWTKQGRGAIWHLGAVWRWRDRWGCHQSLWCCQYVDLPSCNGAGHLVPLPF